MKRFALFLFCCLVLLAFVSSAPACNPAQSLVSYSLTSYSAPSLAPVSLDPSVTACNCPAPSQALTVQRQIFFDPSPAYATYSAPIYNQYAFGRQRIGGFGQFGGVGALPVVPLNTGGNVALQARFGLFGKLRSFQFANQGIGGVGAVGAVGALPVSPGFAPAIPFGGGGINQIQGGRRFR